MLYEVITRDDDEIRYGTDPASDDTDKDGLIDGEEAP